jgi:RNA polymerase sigma-70 factor (ECF subfamily)
MDPEAAYDRYGRQLFRHALALTRQRQDAEDAVQNAFLKWVRRGRRDRIVDLEAFLHTVVRGEALRLLARRRPTVGLDADALVASTNGTTAPEVEQLNRCLHRLPAKQREVLVLHVFEGLTFRRIAEVLGISPDTVASRYRYGRDKLKEWLSGHR